MAADTFSSELGILSRGKPRLLTSWNFREVPPGTNGGVTLTGTLAGFLGALTIALTSVILLPFCTPHFATQMFGDNVSNYIGRSGWRWQEKCLWVIAVTLWGGLGSLLDSFLGGWLQASVVDVRTGKVIEGSGGKKVGSRSRNGQCKAATEFVSPRFLPNLPTANWMVGLVEKLNLDLAYLTIMPSISPWH